MHVFLSPHLDDAVLSCGGMIHQLVRAGHAVQVITVFAGDPAPGPLTPFARQLHNRWGACYADRRREDLESLSGIGAQAVHWPYPEAAYRRQSGTGAAMYDSEESIFGEVHASDAEVMASIASRLRSIDSQAQWLVPLAAGHHVDHQIVRAAAESARRDLVYYEDYPYAEAPEKLAEALGRGPWTPDWIVLSDDALRAKVAAIRAHRSQLSTFFRDPNEMEQRLRAYAGRVGEQGGAAERLWRSGPG